MTCSHCHGPIVEEHLASPRQVKDAAESLCGSCGNMRIAGGEDPCCPREKRALLLLAFMRGPSWS
jgi:hypothetical protein